MAQTPRDFRLAFEAAQARQTKAHDAAALADMSRSIWAQHLLNKSIEADYAVSEARKAMDASVASLSFVGRMFALYTHDELRERGWDVSAMAHEYECESASMAYLAEQNKLQRRRARWLRIA